jgi:Protein of unknown function (DUF3515)
VVVHRLVAGLLVIGGAGAASSCGSAVEVRPPAHAAACEPATGKWPTTVARQARAEVDVDGDQRDAAAWGDPAVIATCGWPAVGPTDDECLDIDGVYWVVERLTDGVRFTTFGRDPAIEVLVPEAYAPEPLLLPAFRDAARALPENGRRCR